MKRLLWLSLFATLILLPGCRIPQTQRDATTKIIPNGGIVAWTEVQQFARNINPNQVIEVQFYGRIFSRYSDEPYRFRDRAFILNCLSAMKNATERGGISTVRGDFLGVKYRDKGGKSKEVSFQFHAQNLDSALGASFAPILKQTSHLLVEQNRNLLKTRGKTIKAITLYAQKSARTIKDKEGLKKAINELVKIDERAFDFTCDESHSSYEWGVTYDFGNKQQEEYSFIFPVDPSNPKALPPLPSIFSQR